MIRQIPTALTHGGARVGEGGSRLAHSCTLLFPASGVASDRLPLRPTVEIALPTASAPRTVWPG